MTGSLDPFDFVLAEQLHMTVDEMRDRMGNVEYHQWRAFHVYREAQRDLALKSAAAEAKIRGRR